MIRISRLWLTVITVTFGIFLDAMGALRASHFAQPLLALTTNLFYLFCLLLTALAFKSTRLPTWASLINLAAVVLIPAAVHTQHVGTLIGDNDTWYVTALAILLGAMAVREQIALAVLGTLLLAGEVMFFGGWSFIAQSGLSGAVLLVVACLAISIGLERSASEITEFQKQSSQERHEILINEASRAEHLQRVSQAIERVAPTLKEIASGKKLSKAQRENVSRLAQELDDEISGGRLAVDSMKKAIASARERSIEVTLIDELEVESDEQLSDLIDLAVAAINQVSVGRIKVIAPKGENYLLRLTATRPGVVTPDLDLKLGER